MGRPRLVVKTQTAARIRLIWVGVAVVAGLAGYGLFELGRYKGGYNALEAAENRVEFETTIADMTKQTEDLRQQVALLETSREIDGEAYVLVEKNLAELQARIHQQEKDLAFYRGIVSPADNVTGLRIQEFEVTEGARDSLYRLKLVLVQAIKHDRRVSGVVNLSVDGALNGEPMSYGLSELTPSDGDGGDLAYSFRYFQDFEHEVILPSGFTPDRVTIEVRPNRRSARTIRQSYDWPVKSS